MNYQTYRCFLWRMRLLAIWACPLFPPWSFSLEKKVRTLVITPGFLKVQKLAQSYSLMCSADLQIDSKLNASKRWSASAYIQTTCKADAGCPDKWSTSPRTEMRNTCNAQWHWCSHHCAHHRSGNSRIPEAPQPKSLPSPHSTLLPG